MEIKETQIENILIGAPHLMQRTLGLDEEPRLIGRQIVLPSGRLDMLYAYQKDLLLIELKVAMFQKRFIHQVLDYRDDLLEFQQQGKLIAGRIQPFLLIPKVREANKREIESRGVLLKEYNPEDILSYFYNEKLRPITYFSELKPIDIGIWNIHLINKFIYFVAETNSVKDLQNVVQGSPKTLYNKMRFASELGLINRVPHEDYIELSKLGEKYVSSCDKCFQDVLSEGQVTLLKNHVMQNPYESAVVLGIASMVECVFALSKTTYPVPVSQLEEYFTLYSGKIHDWQTEKAKKHGAKMYSNYAIDLGLLAKTDTSVFLTPDGFKFVIQMQLHKSLKLMSCVTMN